MARLIIGHTTPRSTRIWVRGDQRNPAVFLNVSNADLNRNLKMTLEERFGYTGVFDVGTLQPDTMYNCEVTFGRDQNEPSTTRVEFGHTRGHFKTFPPQDSPNDARFLIGSCNLHSLGIFQNPDDSFRTLLKISDSENADFMIHCGDQIYYDIPNFLKRPDFAEYRLKYLDAWGDSRPTRKLLTVLPHYMVLDDHELVNNFSNDMLTTPSGASTGDIIRHGIRVYREFQHIHNPNLYDNQSLYYHFAHGGIQFFCLDTRSERISDPNSNRTMMIDDIQMRRFKGWLTRHRTALKFVITSVPFVGHVENNTDKWSGDAFRRQREEIIEHILVQEITGMTFLTGDMHNSYHATMTVESSEQQTVIHELMSSPINQTSKSGLGKYLRGARITSINNRFDYTSNIRSDEFFNDHSNAMLVKVRNRRVQYEVFRARTGKRRELAGSFAV